MRLLLLLAALPIAAASLVELTSMAEDRSFHSAAAQDSRIAIVHAKAYLDPGEPAVENATIFIDGGKVRAAGPALAVPPGVRVVDAMGQTVTPGMMNSDSQLGLVETLTEETTDSAVSSGPYGASFDVQYALNPNSTLLPVVRAQGLTRAMVLPTGSATPPFCGRGAVLRLSEGSEILDRAQAAVVAEVGGMVVAKSGGSRSAQWMLIRSALDAAVRTAEGEAKRAPVRSSSTRMDAARLMEQNAALSSVNVGALLPVIQGKIPLVILAFRESDLRQSIALAEEYKIHVVLVGAEEAWRVADILAAHKIPVVIDPFASTPATYDQIGARLDNAAILDRAGVLISFRAAFVHVSHNAGLAIREGAGVAVANGLPWSHALKALTINPAQTWGIADHYGTLKPGMDADLALWDGDPLEPASAPVLVLVRGREVSLRTRQTELEERYSPRRRIGAMPPAYK